MRTITFRFYFRQFFKTKIDSEERDLVLLDGLNAIIGEREDHSFRSKANNHHKHGNDHEDVTSAKSKSHHDHGHWPQKKQIQ